MNVTPENLSEPLRRLLAELDFNYLGSEVKDLNWCVYESEPLGIILGFDLEEGMIVGVEGVVLIVLVIRLGAKRSTPTHMIHADAQELLPAFLLTQGIDVTPHLRQRRLRALID